MNPPRPLLQVAAAFTAVAGFATLPLLAAGSSGAAPCVAAVADDGSPSILGPAPLSASQLRAWWERAGRRQPPWLAAGVDEVIGLYLSEGSIEGVRGDLAFAQAVLETGYFTNSDTARNNFAGIAHYDDAASGRPFDSPAIGVRAHIQLLHRFAAGNDVLLSRPDVAPNAGGHAETWAQLAGTWATNTRYWTSLQALYATMTGVDTTGGDPVAPVAGCGSAATVVGGYALPLERRWYDEHPTWFTKPHHDYPAADIPVPSGTQVLAVVAGVIVGAPDGGRCGTGVVLDGDDGAQYSYCHGITGERQVSIGERVEAGQLLMLSGNTGNSTGPHLHFGVRIGGQQRCPQNLFVSVAEGRPVDVANLPASGCSH